MNNSLEVMHKLFEERVLALYAIYFLIDLGEIY